MEVLLEITELGEELTLGQVWESIEAIVPRRQLREAVDAVSEMVPPPGADADAEARARLMERIATVTPFLKILTEVIEFGCTPEAGAALAAMRSLPRLLDRRTKVTAADIDHTLLSGSWKSLVLPKTGRIDRNAYVFCVLTAFHRHLRRREIYAEASSRWRDPRAQLLAGEAWDRAKGPALTDLQLREDPDALLAEQACALDAALRDVAAQVSAGALDARVDDQGRLHVPRLTAIPEPPSLVDLRKRVAAMLPRVDLPEVILEVMAWVPAFTAAFTSVSGGRTRLEDLHVSVAACLTAQALNIGYAPVAKRGVPALEPDRLAHVSGTYLSAETFSLANAPLIDAQADIPFARALGGGLVAAIDGMRFVVPVPSVYARPNRKYFGPKRGVTWLNMINDQVAGLGGKVVAGTVRDSLHMIDVLFNQDGGQRPDIVVSDTGSYSDLVFGLVSLLGVQYRPALADLPDQKGWRISPSADYGPLNAFARGRIDLGRIRAHWHDILRVVVSIYTGEVRAYDVVRMLQRDGHPTALGEAIASYGRIPKTLHICTLATEEPYRRDIKAMRNLQEGRHALAAKIFHVPALPRGHGRPARRTRADPQLRGAMEHPLHQRRPGRPARPGSPRTRQGRRPALTVRPRARQCGRQVQLPAPRPGRGRHPPAARPRRRRRRAARLSSGTASHAKPAWDGVLSVTSRSAATSAPRPTPRDLARAGAAGASPGFPARNTPPPSIPAVTCWNSAHRPAGRTPSCGSPLTPRSGRRNNLSERGVRPLKTQQKISGRLTSEDGGERDNDLQGGLVRQAVRGALRAVDARAQAQRYVSDTGDEGLANRCLVLGLNADFPAVCCPVPRRTPAASSTGPGYVARQIFSLSRKLARA